MVSPIVTPTRLFKCYKRVHNKYLYIKVRQKFKRLESKNSPVTDNSGQIVDKIGKNSPYLTIAYGKTGFKNAIIF